jgi:predicted RNA-binding Zn-ribbon protein involved in translation (DUF1610 family)
VSDTPQFNQAVRQMRESELRCPGCKEVNIPGRKKKIELDAHYRATCDNCGHVWSDKEPE